MTKISVGLKDIVLVLFQLASLLCIGIKTYRKIASSNMSHLEAHADFFKMLMKGIFDCYVL